jgi:NAD(P)-dependent dehydrogenase (short-subunit alcohol dehydrogenase family)
MSRSQGGVIGRETAIAYATAGAKHLVLIGLTRDKLEETERQAKNANGGKVKISIFDADVTDESVMTEVARKIGNWHALAFCAGWMPAPSTVAMADIGDFWKSYEVGTSSLHFSARQK